MKSRRTKWTLVARSSSYKKIRWKPSAKTAPDLPKVPWLSDVDTLLNAVADYFFRAVKTLFFGLFAMSSWEPITKIHLFSTKKKFLSWTSLLVLSSAALAIFVPERLDFDKKKTNELSISSVVHNAANPTSYLGRFVLVLLVAYITSNIISWILSRFSGRTQFESLRLMVAIIFAWSMLLLLMGGYTYPFLLEEISYGRLASDRMWIRILYVLAFSLSVGSIVWISSAVAGCRLAASVLDEKLPNKFSQFTKYTIILGAGIVGFLTPYFFCALILLSINATRDFINEIMTPEEKIVNEHPEWSAQIIPTNRNCSKTISLKGNFIDCTLIAMTSGAGHLFLDFRESELIFTTYSPYRKMKDVFAIDPLNRVPAQNNVKIEGRNARSIPISKIGSIDYPKNVFGNSMMTDISIGTPLVLNIRFDLKQTCASFQVFEVVKKENRDKYQGLYVTASPNDEHFPDYSIKIGPWMTPAALIKNSCAEQQAK